MCVYVLKLQTIKLAHTLEIDRFSTNNNQFDFDFDDNEFGRRRL